MPKGKASRRRKEQRPTTTQPHPKTQTKASEIRDFSHLPEALIVTVLLKLPVEDICSCICSCRAFKNAVSENCFWQKYCFLHWGQKTEPADWLISSSTSRIPNLPQPQTYRVLALWFSQLDSFVDFWQGPVNAYTGQRDLFKFIWLPSSIACCNVASLSARDIMYISPRHYITGKIVDDDHCILWDYGESSLLVGCSSAATAAASVAVGHLSNLQTEQSSSFESEMMLYLQSTVRSKRKKARQRCQRDAMVPHMHHFTRLPVPSSTKHTWLTGLWSRDFSRHGIESKLFEAILIQYDYSGSRAQICSKWIAGTDPPPEGDELWRVSARPTVGQLSSSLNDLRYEGSGSVWDEVRARYIEDIQGTLEVTCQDCISFKWPRFGPEEGCITYHRLVADIKSQKWV